MRLIIVGAGEFGVTSALELARRGHHVTVIDDLPSITTPHPYAASTDTSKLIRPDYASNEFYTKMMNECLPLWREFNRKNGELYHESGLLFVAKNKLKPGSFEYDSLQMHKRMLSPVKTFDKEYNFKQRHPIYNPNVEFDGYFNPVSGWAESGEVVRCLLNDLVKMSNAVLMQQRVVGFVIEGDQVKGVRLGNGQQLLGDRVIVAAGSWSPSLLPHLSNVMHTSAQFVFHLRIPEAEQHLFVEPQYPAWAADITDTGMYGFPLHHHTKWLKFGIHQPGYVIPNGVIPTPALIAKILENFGPVEEQKLRKFLREYMPFLANHEIAFRRVCLYCDTFDSNFLIDNDPKYKNLVIATGGSGHAFKFLPVIGKLIADVVDNKPNEYRAGFAWREPKSEQVFDDIRARDPLPPDVRAKFVELINANAKL